MPFNLRERLFARIYDRTMGDYEAHFAPNKRELFAGLEGRGIEIGPGTGANLGLLPSGVRWTGVETNEHMHAPLRARASDLGMEIELQDLSAQRLPFDDESFDFAISTLVLCSVPDPTEVLAEIRRVLRPGASLVFWEHTAAPAGTWLNRFQRILTPLWRIPACGCRLDRNLAQHIHAAGFEHVTLEEFRAPRSLVPALIEPHIRGTARR